MTIDEVRNLFVGMYKVQSQVRGVSQIEINNKLLASFLSQAQQDIQRRLLVVESSVDVILTTTTNVHSLPTNFGQHKHAYIGTTVLEEKPARFIRELLATGGTGNYFGIYQQGNTQQIITPHTSGTLTLFYYPDYRYYQPSVSSNQDWGNFNGIVYTGKLLLPDRYDMAVVYYMLSQVIPDYDTKYEKELRSLRGSRVSSMGDGFSYEFGGVQNVTPTITTAISTTGVPTDTADKKIRFRVSDNGGNATVGYQAGWSTTPTIVNNTSTIVISSADSEFTNFIHVEPNNEDFTWFLTGSTTITITADPASGWGDIEIIIEVWD